MAVACEEMERGSGLRADLEMIIDEASEFRRFEESEITRPGSRFMMDARRDFLYCGFDLEQVPWTAVATWAYVLASEQIQCLESRFGTEAREAESRG